MASTQHSITQASPAAGETSTQPYTVTGTVASPALPGIAGLTVRLVDKNVGGDRLISAAQTASDGSYAFTDIPVSAADLARFSKTAPDWQVQVYSGTSYLGGSAVSYVAPAAVTLDVTLPPGTGGLPSEYETLTANLAAAYPGSLGALQEGGGRTDITYLANRTGWDARAVALAALASQFSGLSARPPVREQAMDAGATQVWAPAASIAPEFYYALFRAGLPASQDGLFQASPATVTAIWQQAIAGNVIPAALAKDVPEMAARFQALSAARSLTAPPAAGVSTLSQMLEPVLREPGQQQQFASLLAQYSGDWDRFWPAATQAFGTEAAGRLQLFGQLYSLTVNSVPVVSALLAAEANQPVRAVSDLPGLGYYDAARWAPLIGESVPPGMPGDTVQEQAAAYAELIAAQVRVSFPTAVLAAQVGSGVLPVSAGLARPVSAFLAAQDSFEIGVEPVAAYLARTGTAAPAPEVLAEVQRLQRVYQLTPDDTSMGVLLGAGLDSAYAITRYDAAGFARAFGGQLGGGADQAAAIHQRARQIFSATLSVAVAYLGGRVAPGLGGLVPVQWGLPPQAAPPGYPVTAYPTLEDLFGSMDYCNCSDCGSILSPAAYLVDLLNYLDQPAPSAGGANPQDALLQRRPDLQYLPLTCANTNTALPYIDIVNETLEYFVANGLSMAGYTGHDTGDSVTSAELVAGPQYVNDAAYTLLSGSFFPPPLPFSRPLTLLRLQLASLGVALPDAMTALRSGDQLVNTMTPASYGWDDILMERLAISRDEYRLFTDPALTLGDLYGLPDGTALEILQTTSLQDFSRRLGVSYDDLAAIISTRFINPNAALIPRLEALDAPFSTLQALHDNLGTPESIEAQFISALPAGLDATQYGGTAPDDYAAVVTWVTSDRVYPLIMDIITISNPTGNIGDCSGADLQLRYSNPDTTANLLSGTDFVKLIRFIRLWRKLAPLLGDASDAVTIAQADAILAALYPAADLPSGTSSTASDAASRVLLDQGFAALLPRTGFLLQVLGLLSLTADTGLAPLLACWAPIGTAGPGSLYQAMFLAPTLLQQAGGPSPFADDGYGDYLTNPAQTLSGQEPALCAACHLTGAEFTLITQELGFTAGTPLTLDNVSALFRYGWLAHALGLSVLEFLLLRRLSGLDPFAPLDPSPVPPAQPPVIAFTALLAALSAAGLDVTAALYLIWNADISGDSAPSQSDLTGLVLALTSDFATVEAEFAISDDPDGTIAQGLMTLVYGSAASDFFFGLLNGTLTTSVSYSAPPGDASLPQPVTAASAGRLGYDDLRKQLSFGGVLDSATQAAIDTAIPAGWPTLAPAVASLAAASQQAVAPFFTSYPELEPLYAAYVASAAPAADKRNTLLAGFLPVLKDKRKQEQALAAITAAAGTDPSFAAALLTDPAILSADGSPGQPAIADLTAVESQGLTARFFLGNDPSATPDQVTDVVPALSYGPAATVGGTATAGDTLTATINGIAIAYTVTAADTTPELLAASIAAAISAATATDPVSSLPLRQVVAAAAAGPVITLAGQDPSGRYGYLTLACSVSAGATETFTAGTQLPSGGTPIAATWSGFITAPQDGDYDIDIVTDPGATITLTLNGSAVPVASVGGLWSNTAPVALTAGELLPVTLTATSVATTLSVSWQSLGLGWQPIPAAYLFPAGPVTRLADTYVRFLKATSLASALSLTAAETSYLATAADVDPGWLNQLAVQGAPAPGTAAALTGVLTALLDFAAMKKALSPSDGRLLAVLSNPSAALPSGASALLSLTGWAQDSVNALLTQFFGSTDPASLGAVRNLRRVYDAYAVVKTCGLSAASLVPAITNAPTAATVSALQSALRAQYAEADWLTVVRPINDSARIQQRDALVAYVLQQLGDRYEQDLVVTVTSAAAATGATGLSCASTAGLSAGMTVQGSVIAAGTVVAAVSGTTVTLSLPVLAAMPAGAPLSFAPAAAMAVSSTDSLYEYLLIDTQTQPPVLTSRMLLAISATQLFTERVTRNLEPAVSALDIDPAQWTWMKRYRVWQANREVFLWPENWLYPELRDNSSPLFQQVMTGLLQGDITDDAAASAYLTYLTGLEEVAKLEPCGHFYVPATGDTDETDYVIARTSGAHRKHYFRELTGGSWTPWAQVQVDCEDMPLTPIVWNGRLFLFWLKVIKQAAPQRAGTGGLPSGPVASYQIGDMQDYAGSAQQAQNVITVSATLCWSEFYNGAWQPTKTSDVSRPASLGSFPATGPGAVETLRNQIQIVPAQFTGTNPQAMLYQVGASQLDVPGDALMLSVVVAGAPSGGFLLHNSHSLPVVFDDLSLMGVTIAGGLGPLGAFSFEAPVGVPLAAVLDLASPSRSFPPYDGAYTGGFAPSTFSVSYQPVAGAPPTFIQPVLDYQWAPRYLDAQPGLAGAWDAPFIYEDRRNLFWVRTTQSLVPIWRMSGFGLRAMAPALAAARRTVPPLQLARPVVTTPPGQVLGIAGTGGDPAAMQRLLATAPAITAALPAQRTVTYQGQVISPVGSLAVLGPTTAPQRDGEIAADTEGK